MGLDMYLVGKRYLKDSTPAAKLDPNEANSDEGYKELYEQNELAYWRKSNAIHKWFVDNVQGGTDDCGYYLTSRKHLAELQKVCERVIGFKHLANEQLPTQSGFFFGGTDYDEYYYRDVEDTIKTIDNVIAALDADPTLAVYYTSSW